MYAGEIIDTHVHVWNFEKASYPWLAGNPSILNRTYHFQEIIAAQKELGIAGSVLVQSANNVDDTDWMLEVAASEPSVAGVVGWLPLLQPAETVKALEEKYSRNPFFKGVRHLIHDETDPQWLLQEPVLESLAILAAHDLPFDVVGVLPQHIETVLEVANRLPSLRLVFDHLNQPPLANRIDFGRWSGLMTEAAALPNFYAKISGLGTVVQKDVWLEEDLQPAVAFVLEKFGSDRCFCGGDWPVSLLAGTYTGTWKVYKSLLSSLLTEAECGKVFAANAKRFYHL